MEFIYKKFNGKVDPKTPNQSLKLLVFVSKILGVHPPDSQSKIVQNLHTIYSITIRVCLLYLFNFIMLMFLIQVSDIKEMADALFLFMTQISLTFKIEFYFKNRFRLANLIKRLDSDLFCPQTCDEDLAVKNVMLVGFFIYVLYASTPTFHMCALTLGSFLSHKDLIPIWHPFEISTEFRYYSYWFYQAVACVFSAANNVTNDSTVSLLILHSKGQLDRLGIMISKIGYEETPKKARSGKNFVDQEMSEMNAVVNKMAATNSKNHAELTRCVLFHKKIIEFVGEIQDLYKYTIFCQFIFSSLILCMTMITMAAQKNIIDILPFMAYLSAMSAQILVYCYSGSELLQSSENLTKSSYFSNFPDFDARTSNSLRFFMKRVTNLIQVKAGTLFQFTLSLDTFMAIIQSAYSYFALLRTMQGN